jgi:hypothetical protein
VGAHRVDGGMRFLTILGVACLLAGVPAVADAATPPHRIKADSSGLYDTVTGQRFTPRGANHVRLASSQAGAYHSNFEPGKFPSRTRRTSWTG